MSRKADFFKRIEQLRTRYWEALPGKESLVNVLSEAEVPENVYNSNAIENSTLSLEETEKILMEIDLDRFINQRELFEAKNLARVVSYLDSKAKEKEMNLELILLLHKMLLSNIEDKIAGRFRNELEWVRVGTHVAPDPKEVTKLLEKMLHAYNAQANQHVVERIALQHLTFEYIHPFVDGNGRIGRVLNNYFLLREGYVPINIKFSNRSKYYSAFEEFQKNSSTKIMQGIVGRALCNSYHKRLAYLEGKKIVLLKDYAKKSKESASSLLNKAHRQTIEAFIEKGAWKIGV